MNAPKFTMARAYSQSTLECAHCGGIENMYVLITTKFGRSPNLNRSNHDCAVYCSSHRILQLINQNQMSSA